MEAAISEKPSDSNENGCNGRENRCNGQRNRYDGLSDSTPICRTPACITPDFYNKPLQMIGMAKKAGFLAVGSDAVLTAIRAGKAELVVFASDTSEGSIKRARYEADRSGVISISVPYTKFEFSRIAGRGSPGTLAILDLGLAEGFTKRLSVLDMTEYGEIARLLKAKVEAKVKPQRKGEADKKAKADKMSRAGRAGKTKRVGDMHEPEKTDRANKADRADNRRAKV